MLKKVLKMSLWWYELIKVNGDAKKNAQNEFIISENAQNDALISLKLVYMASSI